MSFSVPPKVKRNISRIIPFGFIWLFCGWVFLINDLSLTRNQNLNPETDITITLPVFIFANISLFLVGLLIGTMEMVVFEKRFRKFSLLGKIGTKLLIYLGLLFIIVVVTYLIAGAIEMKLPPYHSEVLNKMGRFLGSITFLNTSLQLGFQLFLSVVYAAITENLGHNVFRNFFTGKYHTPKIERRIFMFLDMKQSTAIAEQLGHVAYFDFLQKYYELMSDPIIENFGEVYQYVGDEVVITWDAEKGLKNQYCISCYFDLKKQMETQQHIFLEQFGISPDFKAGMHIGEVSIGEIGALKKEIVYSGDVLNTTARIQSLCKQLGHDLILSEDLKNEFSDSENYTFEYLDEITLQGKVTPTKLFATH
ncbi:MAG: adenylate/guanylate cyclase domain-containing protein [Balneolales bacterium]|nr:adenylate/guanylate cyclase domain-containing protein [Balneolales bacterium]